MKHLFLALLVITPLAMSIGCKKHKSPAQPATITELRIFNSTTFILHDCTVDPSGTLSDNPGATAHNYGQVGILEKTSYQSFPKIYRYAWIKLMMNSKTYYFKPYDYTGESALESGRYTYKLIYNSANDQLNLEFMRD